jgi:prepilin-type N-terminal cleavage/methylation domain-containing protein
LVSHFLGEVVRQVSPRSESVSSPLTLVAERGFSLLEVLTALAISSILALTAVLNVPEVMESFKRSEARQQLFYDIKRARNEASASGARTVMRIDGSGTSYAVGLDRFPFSSTMSMDSQLFLRELPNRITLNQSQTLVFDPRGYLIDSAGDLTTTTLTLSSVGTDFYSANVYPTGYIDVQ